MSAEADAVCGAAYGTVSEERVNRRNGYRARECDTRAGTIELAIPKLRQGTYFPEWLLERRKRAERARTSVAATCYLLGVSTRRLDKLLASLGITTLSKPQVSEMAKEPDSHVEEFRTRSLTDAGPFPFVAADARVLKVRDSRRGLAACEEPEREPAAALDRVAVPAMVRFHFQFVVTDEVGFEPDASWHALTWAGALTLRCDTV
jgi:putative transposase